jgi:DNA polymerase-3 subunit alpha
VLTPEVNRSSWISPPSLRRDLSRGHPAAGSPGAITFGLSAIRNVGEGLVELLLAERDANGPFASFHDFVERVPEPVLNKRTVESLIKAGAFDSLGHPRRGLLMVFEQIIDATLVRRRERDQGVMSLFGDIGGDDSGGFDERVGVPINEFDKSDRLRFEKEMLGLYVSDHPLLGVEAALRRKVDCGIAEAPEREDGAVLMLGGVITNMARKFTKKGDQMAVFVLEDLDSAIEVTVFPRALMELGHKLVDDAIVTVKGRVDKRDDVRVGFMALDVTIVEGLDASAAALRLKVPSTSLNELKIHQIRKILRDHPGDSPVYLHIGQGRYCAWQMSSASTSIGPSANCGCCSVMRRSCSNRRPSFRNGRFSGTMETSQRRHGSSTACQSRWKPGTVQRSPTPISTKWRRWAERSTSECCRKPKKIGCCAQRRASTTSCTVARSRRSSASAARRVC